MAGIKASVHYAFILGTAFSMLSTMASAQASAATIGSPLANVCATVVDIIGLVSIVLFILGGTLYAIAHMLPAAGNIRGNIQGWSLGMIMGAIAGLILVLLAPQLLGLVFSAANSHATSISAGLTLGCPVP